MWADFRATVVYLEPVRVVRLQNQTCFGKRNTLSFDAIYLLLLAIKLIDLNGNLYVDDFFGEYGHRTAQSMYELCCAHDTQIEDPFANVCRHVACGFYGSPTGDKNNIGRVCGQITGPIGAAPTERYYSLAS